MVPSHNRFIGLFKNLGIALLNATLLLVIVAAVSVAWAAYSLRDFASDTARDVTVSAIEAANLDPGTIVSELRNLDSEIEALRNAIEERQTDGAALAALNARLDTLERQIGLLTNPQEWKVSDRVIDRITERIGGILKEWRACGQTPGGQSTAAKIAEWPVHSERT